MHEWALAEAVVASVVKTAADEKLKKVTRVTVKLGELQQIDPEVFKFAVNEVSRPQKPVMKEAVIDFETEPALLKCRACGHEWPFHDSAEKLTEEQYEAIHFIPEVAHVYLRCPKCDSPDFEFTQGRGIRLDSIEGE